MANPGLFFYFRSFQIQLYRKIQWDSNSARRRWRRARWPLDHHHVGMSYGKVVDNTYTLDQSIANEQVSRKISKEKDTRWAVVMAQLVKRSLPTTEIWDLNPVIGKIYMYNELYWKEKKRPKVAKIMREREREWKTLERRLNKLKWLLRKKYLL